MKAKRKTIVTMMLGGGLAGLGAAVFYLTGHENWMAEQPTGTGKSLNGLSQHLLGGL